jgi:hypothetical protein
MNQLIIQAALATADNLEQRAKAIRAEVATITGKHNATLKTAIDSAIDKRKPASKKRDLSPEARQRIADAQKKRWAKFRKEAK